MENNNILRASTIVSDVDKMTRIEPDFEIFVRKNLGAHMADQLTAHLELTKNNDPGMPNTTKYSVEIAVISVEEYRNLIEYKRLVEKTSEIRLYEPRFHDIITK